MSNFCDDSIVFIYELARILGTSDRTIRRQLRFGTFFIPELPKVDQRHRWSRRRVMQAISESTLQGHRDALVRRTRQRSA